MQYKNQTILKNYLKSVFPDESRLPLGMICNGGVLTCVYYHKLHRSDWQTTKT